MMYLSLAYAGNACSAKPLGCLPWPPSWPPRWQALRASSAVQTHVLTSYPEIQQCLYTSDHNIELP